MEDKESRDNFSGKLGFVIAAASSAVGLGNIWRFPYLAEMNGGGIFLFVYIIFAATFGFTLLLTEVAIGRRTGKSCIVAFKELSKKYAFIGWIAAIVPAIIVPYYCVIGGWVTKYLATYTIGAGADATSNSFFGDFITGTAPGIFDNPMIWFLIFAGIVIVALAFGVEKGIEKLSKILMPILLILLIIIATYALTLDGAGKGLEHYILPDFSQLTPSTALGAIGQLFYSMSLAMGIMITYGSYMKKDVDIEKSVRNISIIDTAVAFLAGLMIIPAIYAVGGGEITAGPGLMFAVLPKVFAAMPGGEIVAWAFFLLTLFAAATSAISLGEALVSIFCDRLMVSRMVSIAITSALILGLGTLSCVGYGTLADVTILDMQFLDFFDYISNNVLMPIVGILTCLFVGFVVKPKFIIEEVENSGEFKFKTYYKWMVMIVCPICLFLILLTGVGIISI